MLRFAASDGRPGGLVLPQGTVENLEEASCPLIRLPSIGTLVTRPWSVRLLRVRHVQSSPRNHSLR